MRISRTVPALVALSFASIVVVAQAAGAAASVTSRVSVGTGGGEGNASSLSGANAVSADGRYVVFVSSATNLVTGDTNGAYDVFVRDRTLHTTTRVSVSSSPAVEGNGTSSGPAISSDGRYVAFQSDATNLVTGDTNGATDIFVRDRTTHTTTRVSVSSSPAVEGNGGSFSPAISSDGRYVAFQSAATNLVTGDTNGSTDIFVRDRTNHTTTQVSVSSSPAVEGNDGSYVPAISSDGRYVAFQSSATNLVTGDTNGAADIFVRDRTMHTTTQVSVSSSPAVEGNDGSLAPAISADGRYVAFDSYATNLVSGDTNGAADVFVRDRTTHTTTQVSVSSSPAVEGNDGSVAPAISSDGRYVAFYSGATNLVTGDTNGAYDVFVRDRTKHTTTRESVGYVGEGNGSSYAPAVSADGGFVAFESDATNLVSGDTNAVRDVFVRDL